MDGPTPPRSLLVAVFVGGATGALVRALVDQALPFRVGSWPWSTFLVNIGACLVLGLVHEWLAERPERRYQHLLLGTGFCGGLSTFSTLQVQAVRLAEAHCYGLFAGYLLVSLVVGLFAVWLGAAAWKRVEARR